MNWCPPSGLREEAEVEPDVVADQEAVAGPVEQLLDGILRVRRLGDVRLGDAVHLVADDRAGGLDQRRPAIGDLALLHLHAGDLDDVGESGVHAGRLDVDDDELTTGLDRIDERQHRVGAGLDVAELLGLADGLAELLLEVDQRLEGAVAEQDPLGHDLLGQDLGTRLDHHDRVARSRDDQIEVGVLELAVGRVDDELATDAADSHGPDRAHERDLADGQRRGGRDGADHVGIVLLVRREDGQHDLDVVLVALGEQRPDRPVRQAGGEDRGLRRTGLALDEAARDLARGVHPLLEVDREREEVEAGPRIRAVGRAEDHRVAEANRDGASGQQGDAAGLDGKGATGELGLEDLRQGVNPPVRGGGDDLSRVDPAPSRRSPALIGRGGGRG